jgi:hypothetical protein
MFYGLKHAVKYVLGKDIAARNFTVFPDDSFIVSYLRSGNTWTRFLVANLIHPDEPVTFANIERVIPDTHAQSKRYLKSIPRPRLLKSHQYFDPRYKKVTYIVRDPRDVVLSYYNFQRKYRHIPDGYPMETYVDRFVAGDLNDIGSWGENILSWLAPRHNSPDFLLLRYEEMVAETRRELVKIASFLGIRPTPERLVTAIERSSADQMRKLEKVQGDEWVSTKGRRKDIPFIGDAQAGGWKSRLPESCISKIESAWGPLMGTLGYDLTQQNCSVLEPPFVLPVASRES